MTVLIIDFNDLFKTKVIDAFDKSFINVNFISAASLRHANEIINKSKLALTLVECSSDNTFNTLPIIKKLAVLENEFCVISKCTDKSLHKEYTKFKPLAIFCAPINPAIIRYQIERNFIGLKKSMDENESNSNHFVFKWNSQLRKEKLSEISYIKGEGNYITIVVRGRQFVSRASLAATSKVLSRHFIRAHRNYIVNLAFVTGINISDNNILLQDTKLPIGRKYKKHLIAKFTNYNHLLE